MITEDINPPPIRYSALKRRGFSFLEKQYYCAVTPAQLFDKRKLPTFPI